jgi:cell division protein FtsW
MEKLYNRNSHKITKWWLAIDHNIVFTFIILTLCGALMSFSVSPYVAERIGLNFNYFYNKHIIFIIISFFTAILFSALPPRIILRISLIGLIIFIGLIFLIIFTESAAKGAKRWIRIMGFSAQPSEFIKPFFIIINAWFLSRRFIRKDFQGYLLSITLLAIILSGLILQPDIGMSISFCAVWASQIFIANISILFVFILILMGLFGIVTAYFNFSHVRFRIDNYLFSDGNPTYQVKKSLEAIESGGLFGKGIFEGEVKTLLPDAHTDFIFAVMVEELGMVITFLILSLYFYVIIRIFINLRFIKDPFYIIALTGIASQLAFQIFVNIGVNMNFLPTKGTTLPLISYGGSSTVSTAILIGILLALSKEKFGQLKRNYG